MYALNLNLVEIILYIQFCVLRFFLSYNVIFLLTHLCSSPHINSHSVLRAGNEGPRSILEKRQSNKILGKEKHGKKDGKRKTWVCDY